MLRAVEIYSDANKTLIAVESVVFTHEKSANGGQLFAQVEPVAVVISSQEAVFALDTNGEPTDLDALRHNVSGLNTLLRPSIHAG